MRRHYTNYFRGLPNIKQYRKLLVSEFDTEVLYGTLAEIGVVYGEAAARPPVVA